MISENKQGIWFCLSAWVAVLLIFLFPILKQQTHFIYLSVLIFFLGVPHGAFDLLYAFKQAKPVSGLKKILFLCGYISALILVILFWINFPTSCLIIFLLSSTFHFSGDCGDGTPLICWMLYGAAVIILPSFYYQTDVGIIFSYLTNAEDGAVISSVLHKLSIPLFVACVMTGVVYLKKFRQAAFELLSVTGLAVFAPPLLSFALFFCLMHSARHILRTLATFSNIPKSSVVRAALIPMVATALLALLWLRFDQSVDLDKKSAELIFIGLAALTVPHMAVIEPFRFKKPLSKLHTGS